MGLCYPDNRKERKIRDPKTERDPLAEPLPSPPRPRTPTTHRLFAGPTDGDPTGKRNLGEKPRSSRRLLPHYVHLISISIVDFQLRHSTTMVVMGGGGN